jgi:hypothetical protein
MGNDNDGLTMKVALPITAKASFRPKITENKVFSYDGLNQFGGIAIPSYIVNLLLKILKSKEVIEKTGLIGTKLDEIQLRNNLDTYYLKRYECIMPIEGNILSDNIEESGLRPNYWINFKGRLSIDTVNDKISFKLFTWGQGDSGHYTIRKNVFEKYFYGYVKAMIV